MRLKMRGEDVGGESRIRKGEGMRYTHPKEMAIVVNTLYNSPMRSNELIKEIDTVSGATAHSILKKLVEDGFINKIEQSSRNVSYELSDKGRRLLEEKNIKARDTLVSIVRDLPAQKEINPLQNVLLGVPLQALHIL
jgi:DNA-binding PadR family transcriptional regulator